MVEILNRLRKPNYNSLKTSEEAKSINGLLSPAVTTTEPILKMKKYICGCAVNRRLLFGVIALILLLVAGGGIIIYILLPKERFLSTDSQAETSTTPPESFSTALHLTLNRSTTLQDNLISSSSTSTNLPESIRTALDRTLNRSTTLQDNLTAESTSPEGTFNPLIL